MVLYLKYIIGLFAMFAALTGGQAARAEWWEARTNHFIIYSETSRRDAEAFALDLERFDNALRILQNMPIPGPDVGDANRLKVYRTGDENRLRYIIDASGSGIGGIYFARAGNPVTFVPARGRRSTSSIRGLQHSFPQLDARLVLFHEYTHHFMLANFSTAYPHWYREGFAELYSTIRFNDDGSFHVGDVPQDRGWALDYFSGVRLSRLLDTKAKLTGVEYFQSYSYGWLLAHYLNFHPERQVQLIAYLSALNKGEDSLTAAKRVFGDLDTLQREVHKYRNGPFLGYDVKPANYVAPVVTMRRLTDAEESVMYGHMRTQRGPSRSQARDIANDLAGKAVAWPDSLFVQLTVGEAELNAGHLDAADAAIDRALAIAPRSAAAHYWKARIHLARAESDKAHFAKARTFLVRARNLDKLDPRPAIAYYQSFGQAGEPVTEPAVIALEEVFHHASYDYDYRLLLARQLLVESKGDLARAVLGPIAFGTHRREDDNPVTEIVAMIDENRIADANAKMAELFQKRNEARDGKKRLSARARPQ